MNVRHPKNECKTPYGCLLFIFYQKYFLWLPATLLKKETLAQALSCVFCEISKNIFFTEHLRTTASENETDLKEYKIFSSSCNKFEVLQLLEINVWGKTHIGRWAYLGSLSLTPVVLLHKIRGLRRGGHTVYVPKGTTTLLRCGHLYVHND